MFFLLSKVLSFFTNPLVYVFGFLLASALLKKTHLKKRFFWIGFSLLLFFSNDFIANEAMRAWEVEATPYSSIKKNYEWGIVLTGVTLNSHQPDDRVYFHHGADRVTHAIQLHKLGIVKKILITGGVGRVLTEGRPEADELKKVMVMAGIPQTDIIVENESRNTHENAINTKAILENEDPSNCLLITSAFHMRRSRACFKKAEFETDTFSADFYSHPRYFTPDALIIPSAESINLWQKLFKEWTGIAAYWVAGYV